MEKKLESKLKKIFYERESRRTLFWNMFGLDWLILSFLVIFNIILFFLGVDFSDLSYTLNFFFMIIPLFTFAVVFFVMQLKTVFFPVMTVRRFHDAGKKGIYYFALLATFIIILFFYFKNTELFMEQFDLEKSHLVLLVYYFRALLVNPFNAIFSGTIVVQISMLINIYTLYILFFKKGSSTNQYGKLDHIKSRKQEDAKTKKLIMGVAAFNIIIVFMIFLFIFVNSMKFFIRYPILKFFTGKDWVSLSDKFGFLPLLVGSLWVTMIALIIAVPISLITAVYIAEFASPKTRETLKIVIETMAAIPSVVLGFIGMFVISDIVKATFNLDIGLTALTGGIILAFMAMPTMISIADDSIRSLDNSYKQASLALGGSKMQTIFFVMLPAAFPGIFAGIMLGFGRIIGETMTVLMVTGNAPNLNANALTSVRTMTATIAAEMGEVGNRTCTLYHKFCHKYTCGLFYRKST